MLLYSFSCLSLSSILFISSTVANSEPEPIRSQNDFLGLSNMPSFVVDYFESCAFFDFVFSAQLHGDRGLAFFCYNNYSFRDLTFLRNRLPQCISILLSWLSSAICSNFYVNAVLLLISITFNNCGKTVFQQLQRLFSVKPHVLSVTIMSLLETNDFIMQKKILSMHEHYDFLDLQGNN